MRYKLTISAIAAALLLGTTPASALNSTYTKPSAAKADFTSEFNAFSPFFDVSTLSGMIVSSYEVWRVQTQNNAVAYASSSSYNPATHVVSGSYDVARYDEYLNNNSTYNASITLQTPTPISTQITYTNPTYAPYTGTLASIGSAITFVVNGITGNATYSVAKTGTFSSSNTVTIDPDEGITAYIQGLSLRSDVSSGSVAQTFTKFAASPYPNSSAVSVPGPEAGAGLGALAICGLALYLKRRRNDEALGA